MVFQEDTFKSNVLLSVVLIPFTFIREISWITTRCQQQHTEHNRTVRTGRAANVFSLRAVPMTTTSQKTSWDLQKAEGKTPDVFTFWIWDKTLAVTLEQSRQVIFTHQIAGWIHEVQQFSESLTFSYADTWPSVEATWAAVAACSLLRFLFGDFLLFFSGNLSGSLRLDTDTFRSLQRCLIWFLSGFFIAVSWVLAEG